MKNSSEQIDKIFGDLKLNKKLKHDEANKTVTLWIPSEYQQKFKELQKASNLDFGKRLQKLVIDAIDSVSLDSVGV